MLAHAGAVGGFAGAGRADDDLAEHALSKLFARGEGEKGRKRHDELANAAVLPRFLEGCQDWLETYPVRPFRRYLHFVTLDVVEQGLQATTETHEQVRRGRAKEE